MHQRRGFEIARAAGLDLAVARILQQHRHPADLELSSRRYDEIGGASAGYQARLGIDPVHVLKRAGGGVDVDLVTAQLVEQRSPVGRRGQHLQCSLGRQRRRAQQHSGE